MLIISKMSGLPQLMTKLLYGSGLRLMECLRLRIKDIDFGNHRILVRDGKGEDDRVTILPDSLIPDLQRQIEAVLRIHQTDLADGLGEVWLPHALARKYPNASREFAWQYLFPSPNLSRDSRLASPPGRGAEGEGKFMRHRLDPSLLQKAMRAAVKASGIDKPVSPHTLRAEPQGEAFRHSFATHLLENGGVYPERSRRDIRTVQELLGHKDVRTTMIYTLVPLERDMSCSAPGWLCAARGMIRPFPIGL